MNHQVKSLIVASGLALLSASAQAATATYTETFDPKKRSCQRVRRVRMGLEEARSVPEFA